MNQDLYDDSHLAVLFMYIPYFESTNKKYTVSDQFSLDPFTYDDAASEFVTKLYQSNMIIKFDWGTWQSESREYFQNTALIHNADLLTVRKLFTTIIRADRFCAGMYASMIDKVVILALLKRLKALVDNQEKGGIPE
jgi:ADP-ribosyl-[dinitrogen reductase] hydrolase